MLCSISRVPDCVPVVVPSHRYYKLSQHFPYCGFPARFCSDRLAAAARRDVRMSCNVPSDVVMHNLLEQNAAMHCELNVDNVDNVIALHYVLQAWRKFEYSQCKRVTFGVRVHCNPDPRLPKERAVNCELINILPAF